LKAWEAYSFLFPSSNLILRILAERKKSDVGGFCEKLSEFVCYTYKSKAEVEPSALPLSESKTFAEANR
jgi:hypothetical protein